MFLESRDCHINHGRSSSSAGVLTTIWYGVLTEHSLFFNGHVSEETLFFTKCHTTPHLFFSIFIGNVYK